MASLIGTLQELWLYFLGQRGSTYFNSTTVRTGNWWKITTLAATTFTTLTDATRDGDTVGSDSFPAGVDLYGQFTAITLATGRIIAYKAQE